MVKHSVSEKILHRHLPKMIMLHFTSNFNTASHFPRYIALERSFLPTHVDDFKRSSRMTRGNVSDWSGNMCKITTTGSSSGDEHTCSWKDIVVHSEVVVNTVKIFVPITPLHLLRKKMFYWTETKTVLKRIADIGFALYKDQMLYLIVRDTNGITTSWKVQNYCSTVLTGPVQTSLESVRGMQETST